MEINIVGYFHRFDLYDNVRLVNLEPESSAKLHNCGLTICPGAEKSPILPNGAVIKHNVKALCYDADGTPAITESLKGQLVEARVRAKKYMMHGKQGWTLHLISIKPSRTQ